MKKILLFIVICIIAINGVFAYELDLVKISIEELQEEGVSDKEINKRIIENVPFITKMISYSNSFKTYTIEEKNKVIKQILPNSNIIDQKCGYKDSRGKIVIDAKEYNFAQCGLFKNGVATVEIIGEYINTETGISYKLACILPTGELFDYGACHGFSGHFGDTENWAVNMGIIE